MKNALRLLGAATMLCIGAHAQIASPVFQPGQIAVFKAGTPDTNWPMITARVAPCFVQAFDPALTNRSSTNPVIEVAMSTNVSVPGSVWINHHAGSEGGGISRSVNRQYLALEGYTGNILSSTAPKPSTDFTVTRGIVTLDAFTNPVSVYSSLTTWFGIPTGAAANTQDNPTGIATLDGTNFWGTGNFSGVSSELDGTLFYNPNINGGAPVEVQNYLQAAGEARIIGGTVYIATKTGIYNFVDPSTGQVVPLPWCPDVANPYFNFTFTNLYLNWGTTFKNILNFDMNPAKTIAYGADQTFGIIKFVNVAGAWVQAPYYWGTNNIGTQAQKSGNQGCFGICVDFSGVNPVIYATTMENGAATNYVGGFGVNTAQGHQNNNRLIKIVDTGVNPGSAYVAQTLAIAATTNEFFGGIDFTPDLRPLITANPANYSTTNGGNAPFSVTADSVFALGYQWQQNGTNLIGETSATLNLVGVGTNLNNYSYRCVATNSYGSVTSAPAILIVTLNPVAPVITSGTNIATGFIFGGVLFPAVTATGTEPFTYQWYFGGSALVDGPNPNSDGSGFSGSQTPSLAVTNLQVGESGSYYMVVMNAAGYASNKVDVLTVNFHKATITAGQPASVITFVGTPTSLTAGQVGATLPITNQWYRGTTKLTDAGDFSGTGTATLAISATTTNDSGTNYYIVISNGGGSITSSLASVSVLIPPPLSSVLYTNGTYAQNFDVLPDPFGGSVNSINNPANPGSINGVAYSLANPFDFGYPVVNSSYIGGLGLSVGTNNLNGWYGCANTNLADGVSGLVRYGAQNGDQSTGGIIDFGLNDVTGGVVGTNRSLGLLTTGTTGSTAFGLKLVNKSTNELNYVTLSFLGELWRNNKGSRSISFSYAVDATSTNFVLLSEPTATNTVPQTIPNTIPVPNLAFSFPTNDGVVLAQDGTAATNQVSMVVSNLTLSTPWQPNAALWLVWSMNYYGAGSGQGYAIDNVKFSASALPTTLVQPIKIGGGAVRITGSGASAAASFSFTNGPGLTFSVRATNVLTAPAATWPVVGTTVENPAGSGLYQFTDPTPSTNGALFYRISFP
jgi:hypothetical protein